MSEYLYILLFLFGLLGGFLSGLFGIGGGVIYLLIFNEYFQIYPCTSMSEQELVLLIIANSIFAIFFSGLSGSIKQYLSKNFYPKIFIPLGIFASITSILTSYLLQYVDYNKKYFTIFLAVLVLYLAFKNLLNNKEEDTKENESMSLLKSLGFGSIIGVLVALTGLGGGALLVPFLSSVQFMNYKKAISISIGFILVTSFFTSIYNLFQTTSFQDNCGYYIGLIKPGLVFPMIFGILIASPIGVTVNQNLATHKLKIGFFVFTFLIISRLLYTTFA